jgi:predicted metal-dependent HD superfamily phosphohydrolase
MIVASEPEIYRMDYSALSKRVEGYVINYFQSHHDPQLTYHNFDHTFGVVKAAAEIAIRYKLTERDFFIVTTAAWFHDIGYLKGAENHEEKGAKMCRTFLKDAGIDKETIQSVVNCIMATALPQNPKTELEEIVCDADLFHLGTDSFFERNKLMRKEMEKRESRTISKIEWSNRTIELLANHHYFTGYVQSLLQDKLKENLKKLEDKKLKKESELPIDVKSPVIEKNNDKKKFRPNKEVGTMFRISSSNNQRLSDMADNKAHILISVNSIILSAIISLVLHRLDEYAYLSWPTYLILSVSVVTIIYSILATRPALPSGKFNQQQIEERKVNLLFFGNYYNMSLEDYNDGMEQVMNDKIFMYKTLITDVYAQGIVLSRKYKLLRTAYSIFMYGLIVSVIAFVIASALQGK